MAAPSIERRGRSAVPTIVAQILSCKQPQFRIYDIPIQTVCVVGVIRNISITNFEITCDIEDHSAGMRGVMRLEAESEVTAKISQINVNKYHQIFGTVRVEEGGKVLLMLKFFPVEDLNVITHHLLQYCAFTLEAEEEFNKQLASANTTATALADAVTCNEESSHSSSSSNITEFQKLIFDIVKSELSDEGISKGHVLRQFPSYQGFEVNQALDFLINEGLIYYTDQQHLKAVVNF